MTDENERAVMKRRSLRINALTPEQANAALHYLSGYTPEGIDLCLARYDVPGHALCGAFDALREADPDGAADALIGLVEGDALAKIRARILEEDAAEFAPEAHNGEPACSAFAPEGMRRYECAAIAGHEGDHVGWGAEVDGKPPTWPQDAAPDTAQPEDIPEPTSLADALKASLAAAQPADAPDASCGRCGATEETGPLIDVGVAHGAPVYRCNERQRCAERQARHMDRIAGAK